MLPLGTLASARRSGSTVVVSDSFNRANSASSLGNADTGQAWSSVIGTWGIDANRAYAVGTPGNTWAAAVNSGANPSTTTIMVSARLYNRGANRYPAIFLGAASGAGHTAAYRVFPNGNTTTAYVQNGNTSPASLVACTSTDGALFAVRSTPAGANCTVELLVDGVVLTSISAPARTGTWCGIGTGFSADAPVRFEDFKVETF